jgi:hypothetical protein
MFKELPQFEPVSTKEMRAMWRQYRGDRNIERLLLEIAHGRQVLGEIDVYFGSIRQAWKDEKIGQLVAMEKMRVLLMEQHMRQGALVGLPPPPKKGQPPEPEPELVE